MSSEITFTVSDLITGYVTDFKRADRSFGIRTSDGRVFRAHLTPSTYARIAQNLDEPYEDATARLGEMLDEGQHVFAYGIFYPEDKLTFEVKSLVFPGEGPGQYRFEEPDWWVKQVRSLADSYMRWQFGYPENPIDYHEYRTFLHLAGHKKGDDYLQETDTISRLVYGFASAFNLTGDDAFLEAAEAGTQYLREHMRFYDPDVDLIYWYHGIEVQGKREHKLLTSEFSDDYDSIPAYEQIYALAGPVQTVRVNGDPKILWDAQKTVELFDKYYKDREGGGYFSHVDPWTLDPRSEALKQNRARKNWNSVGDHAPAYLINLYLATGNSRYADFLEDTFDTIEKYFPNYDESPFVQEKFFEDWTPDREWAWQQNRAVVGHNLKIAWNLMRMNSLRPKDSYVALARKIADLMPCEGSDQQRGGWYDVVERTLGESEKYHRFVWHDRKAWWQQEQAILAYLILNGTLGDGEYQRQAREAAAFYNAFFLDHDDGGIYFNVLANGLPYLLGNERLKGSHSMSGYHSMELCYLGAVYDNLLINKNPMDFYFKPVPDGFPDRVMRVAPDLLPPGSIRLGGVWVDDAPYRGFNAERLEVSVPPSTGSSRPKIRVRIEPST